MASGLAFNSNREGPTNLFWQLADGSGGLERLTTSEYLQAPMSWSRDGQLLAFIEVNPTTQRDIWVIRMGDPSAGSGQVRKAQPFLRTRFDEAEPKFSPDGRWLAYISDESGRYEIYVQPYPGPGGKWQISTEGGTEPVWNPNGRELFYRSGDKMMVGGHCHPAWIRCGHAPDALRGTVRTDSDPKRQLRCLTRRPALPDAQAHRARASGTDANQRRAELV